MLLQFTVSTTIPATKETIYNAWLNGGEHTAMTGSAATAGNMVGDAFTAHGDYASGKNIQLVPFSTIVQSWRTTEFEDEEEDSVLEVTLEDKKRQYPCYLNPLQTCHCMACSMSRAG